MIISVYFSAELFIHHNPPPRVHRRATGHAGDRVLRGGRARWQHQGRDVFLRRGLHQMQPQVAGRRVRAPRRPGLDGTNRLMSLGIGVQITMVVTTPKTPLPCTRFWPLHN